MILHAEKSAETPTCLLPVLKGSNPQRHCLRHLRLLLCRTHGAVWRAWSQNKSLQEYPRRSGCSGGCTRFWCCLSTSAHSHCSIQLCRSQQCQLSQARWALEPAGGAGHSFVSCCQCLLLCNDSIWSHFSRRGTIGATQSGLLCV